MVILRIFVSKLVATCSFLELVFEKDKNILCLGFNVRSINDFTSERYHHSVLLDAVPVPGFLALQHLISYHASSHPVLKLLLQYFVGQFDDNPAITEVFFYFLL